MTDQKAFAFDLLVSRDSGVDLNLNDGSTYTVVAWKAPLVGEHRAEEIEGAFQAGSFPTSSVPGVVTLIFTVRVAADGWPAQVDAARIMAIALNQLRYSITSVTETVAVEWTGCRRSPVTPRQNIDTTFRQPSSWTKQGVAEYIATVRCNPNIISEA